MSREERKIQMIMETFKNLEDREARKKRTSDKKQDGSHGSVGSSDEHSAHSPLQSPSTLPAVTQPVSQLVSPFPSMKTEIDSPDGYLPAKKAWMREYLQQQQQQSSTASPVHSTLSSHSSSHAHLSTATTAPGQSNNSSMPGTPVTAPRGGYDLSAKFMIKKKLIAQEYMMNMSPCTLPLASSVPASIPQNFAGVSINLPPPISGTVFPSVPSPWPALPPQMATLSTSFEETAQTLPMMMMAGGSNGVPINNGWQSQPILFEATIAVENVSLKENTTESLDKKSDIIGNLPPETEAHPLSAANLIKTRMSFSDYKKKKMQGTDITLVEPVVPAPTGDFLVKEEQLCELNPTILSSSMSTVTSPMETHVALMDSTEKTSKEPAALQY